MMRDPLDLWNERELEIQRGLDKLPVCDECDRPIQDLFYYSIDGKIYCQECIDSFIEYF